MWRLKQQTREQRETDYPPDNMGNFFKTTLKSIVFRLHAALALSQSKITPAKTVSQFRRSFKQVRRQFGSLRPASNLHIVFGGMQIRVSILDVWNFNVFC